MILETVITIQMISAGICTGVCLVALIGTALDAFMSKKPGETKSPQPEKADTCRDNFIVCACMNCVHCSGTQCGKDRTYITLDGKCKSYVPRPTSGEE